MSTRAIAAGVDTVLGVTVDVPTSSNPSPGIPDEAGQAIDRAALFLSPHTSTEFSGARDVTTSHRGRYPGAMPRWEQGSEERMKQAAIELFAEQGFEATTAVQIAERARVTTRTFFRYFPDKEEIFFADAEIVNETLVQELLRTPDLTQPLLAVVRTLAGHDWEKLGSRDVLLIRSRMIASNPRLLERDLIKQHQIADGFHRALCERGIDPDIAELAAYTGSQIFRMAYQKWLESNDNTDLTTITETVTSLLADIVPVARSPRGRRRAPATRHP